MKNSARNVLDKSFTSASCAVLGLLLLATTAFIVPIAVRGLNAVVFTATVEHDKFCVENLDAELSEKTKLRIAQSDAARAELYKMMDDFESSENLDGVFERVEKSRAEAMRKLAKSRGKILDAAKLETQKRNAALHRISEFTFAEYIAVIQECSQEARKIGKQAVFGKWLANERKKFAKLADLKLSEICAKKFSVVRRSSIRRNLLKSVCERTTEISEKLISENAAYEILKDGIRELLGPRCAAEKNDARLMRQKYGQTRMDSARDVFEKSVAKIGIKKVSSNGSEIMEFVDSQKYFQGAEVEKIVDKIVRDWERMLAPHIAVYLGFFTDNPVDSNIFGGIFPMILGTFYLTLGAMLIAAPLGITAAIYFSEYSRGGKISAILEMCVGTLAGVPSIVFGLFGLAFLINTLKISEGKSVVAGAATLALLILPTIIRSCMEALKAVPNSYREAAYGLGAGKWRAICSVILPAALPSMLTGIIISMGRAAGETAPIIFTAATSTGAALGISEVFSQATPALPWNIYNICAEHEMAERVAHVQYGMVFALMAIVLSLNFVAIWFRAKLQVKKI